MIPEFRLLVGTHTHRRAEVNIMLARAVWNHKGKLRAYNAHFPRWGSWNLWNFFMDHPIAGFNGRTRFLP